MDLDPRLYAIGNDGSIVDVTDAALFEYCRDVQARARRPEFQQVFEDLRLLQESLPPFIVDRAGLAQVAGQVTLLNECSQHALVEQRRVAVIGPLAKAN